MKVEEQKLFKLSRSNMLCRACGHKGVNTLGNNCGCEDFGVIYNAQNNTTHILCRQCRASIVLDGTPLELGL